MNRSDPDGRRPVWAYTWPAGLVLTEMVLGELALSGRRVLELGCGLACVGLAAARVGAQVTVSDRDPEAVAHAQAEATARSISIEGLVLDWGRIPDALSGAFDVVLASDVLYDRSLVVPFLGAVDILLAAGGEAWLTDPGRVPIPFLRDEARAAGLEVTCVRTVLDPPVVATSDHSEDRPVHVYSIRRAAP